jgi:hypothetical protein
MEGLTQNKHLHFVNISGQRSKRPLEFDEDTCEALSYSLETLYCDNNRVNNMTSIQFFIQILSI